MQKHFHFVMDRTVWLNLNAILGSFIVIVGLWLLLGELPLTLAIILALGLAIFLSWWSITIAHVWAVTTLLLGIESLAWPIQHMIDIRSLGPEPPLEDLQRIFTAILFGLFSGIFWMTFSYGIYKRICSKSESSSSQGNKEVVGTKRQTKGKKHR